MKLKNLFKTGLDTSVESVKGMFWAAVIKISIWVVGIVIVIVIGVKTFNYLGDRYACHAQWVDSSVESKFTYRGGCLVNVEGGWIPATSYRVN